MRWAALAVVAAFVWLGFMLSAERERRQIIEGLLASERAARTRDAAEAATERHAIEQRLLVAGGGSCSCSFTGKGPR